MKISLVQMHCVWGKIPVNLRKIEEFAARASEDKADWVLFPELTGFLLLATVLAATIGAPQPPGEGDRVPSKDMPGRDHVFDLNPRGINEPETARVFRGEIEFLHAKLGKHNSSLGVPKRGKGEL